MDVKQVQYCPKCRVLRESASAVCGACQGPMRPPQPEDMIILATDKEFEINTLCEALSLQSIPFEEKLPKVSLSSYQGRGFKGEISIFVRYQDLDTAKRIARKQGFRFPDDPVITPLDEEAAAAVGSKTAPPTAKQPQPVPQGNVGQKSQPKPQEEEISPFKKKMGKVLLFATVIAAIIAVVFLSDWITGLFKGNKGDNNASSAAETSAAQSAALSSEAAPASSGERSNG